MSKICCLLDACTIINFIHIDEEDFLLRKLNKLDLYINDCVFKEVNQNVYVRIEEENRLKYSNKKNIEDIKKTIDQKLSILRSKKFNNDELLKELGKEYFEKIKILTEYSKRENGEFYSVALSLYLSRIDSKKVYFYTDDYPAKKHFSVFFEYQQIGQIKDSVDLLVLLYWLYDDFTEKHLDKILSNLYAQYATEVTLLKDKLQEYYNITVNAQFLKSNREIVEKLRSLLNCLDSFNFNGINTLKEFFVLKGSKFPKIIKTIETYSSVFELENNQRELSLLNKISSLRENLKYLKIQKWNDLCSN